MKRSHLIKLGLLLGLTVGAGASGQVFNVHDIQHGYFFYGGYNVTAFGQGALADPGNNIWNGFGNGNGPGTTCSFGGGHQDDGLLAGNPGNPYAWASVSGVPFFAQGTQLFSPTDSGAPAGNATSAGMLSPVTIPVMEYGFDNNGSTAGLQSNGSTRTEVAQTIFSEAAIVNSGNPGAGTAAHPLGLMVLSNVPPGTYDLYLYGANSDGTRGASFAVDSGTPLNGVSQTINPNAAAGSGPLPVFALGADFTVYNYVRPNADSTIHITWGAVSNSVSGLTGEGDFNGLQLVPSTPVPAFLVSPASAVFAQGTTVTLLAAARGNPGVALQWYKGNPPGVAVAGQTNSTLTLTDASLSEAGNYYAVATNIYGAATSSVATLTIAAAPALTGQTLTTSTNAVILYAGHNHFGMSVSAYGDISHPWSYYWQSNGVTTAVTTSSPSINGIGTSSFGWVNTTASAIYSCIVSNAFGTATNANALAVTIVPAPADPYVAALLALHPFAYWPLDETSTPFTYDYVSGNNGTPLPNSSFLIGQSGPVNGFGANSLAYTFFGSPDAVDVPGANLNLVGPLTLIAWAQPVYANHFNTIVGKGDQSYRLSVDNTGVTHFNDAGGLDAQGGPNVTTGVWHQMVGTYSGSNVFLYVDGILVASETDLVKPSGSLDFYIGGAPDHLNNPRFISGSVAHVAILTNALTAGQVQALFAAGQTPLFISVEPTNVSGSVGGQASFSVVASGGAPVTYQWSGPAGVIPGATNATLVLSNLTENSSANNGPGIYYCTISNPYGSITTPNDGSVQLAINNSQPYFVQDLPPAIFAVAGSTVILPTIESGNPPITNQWFYSATGTPASALRNGGRISGATSATLVINDVQPGDAGYYQLWATNGVPGYTASSQIAELFVEAEPMLNTNGVGWTVNPVGGNGNGDPNINQDLLTLTDDGNSEGTSIFFSTPVYVGAFSASFTYTATGATPLADGATFCIQNSPNGTAATGLGGGGLSYAGITESVALAFDLFDAAPGGIQFVTDGVSPLNGVYTPAAPVILTSGDPINVSLDYNGQTLAVNLTDSVTAAVFTTNMAIGPITQYLGTNTALIGFTAATGSDTSIQTIGNFNFVPLPLVNATRSGTNVVITWPGSVGGYSLQQAASLTNVNWTSIAGPYPLVGPNNQVTVPATGGRQFFRLQLPQ